MKPIDSIVRFQSELQQIRRDLHAHPELCFEERRTADVVAQKLAEWGIEVVRGLGQTGVVGILRGARGDNGRALGLRADMDALPMQEINTFAHALAPPRQDARLRPRRPHRDAAGRRALPGADSATSTAPFT